LVEPVMIAVLPVRSNRVPVAGMGRSFHRGSGPVLVLAIILRS
jgi:hypothetical protein